MRIVLGVFAFALFFANDYNDWKWARRELKACFPTGGLLLAAATILGISQGTAPPHTWVTVFLAVLAGTFLVLLAYTLFFALPTEASYSRPGEERPVVATGVYALCRHPGVLWFIALYLCLWGCTGLSLWETALYSGLNVLLVIFEDRCVFPGRLAGYAEYCSTTPFLLPNRQSLRACRQTLRGDKDHAV